MLRRVTRWIPLATIVVIAALLWGAVLRGGLAGVTAWYLLQLILPALGFCTLIGTLVYAARKRRWKSPAVLVTLGVSFLAVAALLWTFGLYPIAYPASLERTEPAATVRLPADVPLKVGWGGDDLRTNYHAATPDQRWAYDLLVVPYLVGTGTLKDYGCYGVPVVAPASGVVTVAQDGKPDATPGVLSNDTDNPGGNYVSIRLNSTGTHLVVAHLQPGSVKVKVGARVKEGEVIGRCGNSGNTSEPHIHLHHQRQNPAAVPFGFAEGLPLYFRDHDGEPMPTGGLEERNGGAVAVGATVQHMGGREK